MVYPLIVLSAAFLLSCFFAYLLSHFIWNSLESLAGNTALVGVPAALWMSPVLIAVALVVIVIALVASPARRLLRWRLPAFREASLAEVASTVWLLLKNGVPLDDALALVQQLEAGTGADVEIAQWRLRLAGGRGKFSEMAAASRMFPPLFIWTIAQSGEDLTAGFQKAAELFHARALYRSELLLYSALPCSVLALAAMIVSQLQPVFAALTAFLQSLGGA